MNAPMHRLLICPVSREPIPNLLAILHERARRVCLLKTEGGGAVAASLQRLQAELTTRGITSDVIATIDPFDPFAVEKAVLGAIADAGDGYACSVNITTGTKIITAAASLAAIDAGADILYVDTGNGRVLRNSASQRAEGPGWVAEELVAKGLDVATFARLAGCSERPPNRAAANHPKLARLLGDNAPQLDSFVGALRRSGGRDCCLRYRTAAWTSIHEAVLTLASGEHLVEAYSKQCDDSAGELEVSFKVSRAGAKYFAGDWLEDYVFLVATECGFDEVRRNVTLLRPGGSDDLTDIDVAIVHQHRFFALSCKSGEDIRYKVPFDRLVEEFGGLLAGAVVVSTKQSGPGVAAADVGHSRGVRVESLLLRDLPQLSSRLSNMVSRVTRRREREVLVPTHGRAPAAKKKRKRRKTSSRPRQRSAIGTID